MGKEVDRQELGGAEGEETEIRIYSWGGASIPNKRKKIEKQIREIEEQIQRLKQQEKKQETVSKTPEPQRADAGNAVDTYA